MFMEVGLPTYLLPPTMRTCHRPKARGQTHPTSSLQPSVAEPSRDQQSHPPTFRQMSKNRPSLFQTTESGSSFLHRMAIGYTT